MDVERACAQTATTTQVTGGMTSQTGEAELFTMTEASMRDNLRMESLTDLVR